MEIYERLKILRQEFGLTQAEMGEKLGISRDVYANIENNRLRKPAEPLYRLICEKFNVNEEWLRNGTGEMFKTLDREEEIAEIAAALFKNDKALKSKVIIAMAGLDENDLETFLRVASTLSEVLKEND